MRWTAPPDRREIILVLLALITYFFAYNLDTSFETLGVDPETSRGAVLSRLGLGKKAIGSDGRKPAGWRDKLEADIFGDYQWDEGHVAGSGKERSQAKGADRHGATWIGRQKVAKVPSQQLFAAPTVDRAINRWGDNIPQTHVVAHAPGYTILDNVFILNNTVYLITNAKGTLPSMENIVPTVGNGFSHWKVLTADEGKEVMGKYGSTIRGVTWMSADSTPHNSTLFAMWRAYSSLDPHIDDLGRSKLAPPLRILFPHNRFFTDANPDFDSYLIRRRRVDTGFHPYTAKAAFPHLSVQYFEDWDDYQKMLNPFVFERLVVVDRSAAEKHVKDGLPAFSSAFTLPGSPQWWEPVRITMAQFLEVYDVPPKAKPVVTYLHSQNLPSLKLSIEAHNDFVKILQKVGKKRGFEINVVSCDGTENQQWRDRMTAVARSTVVIGVHGSHMMDAVYMRPSPQSTLMELFPIDKYSRDQEFAAQSINLKYMAWWGSRSATANFPTVSPPKDSDEVPIDPHALVRAIVDVLQPVLKS